MQQTLKNMTNNKNILSKTLSGWFPVIIIFLIIIVLAFAVSAKKDIVKTAKKNSIKENTAPINIVSLKLSPKPIKDRINLPGLVKPWVQTVVSTEVTGLILDKKIVQGSFIKKGDIIANIDSAKYLNAYNAAKASYKSALASKKRLSSLYSAQLSNKSDLDNITAQAANYLASMKVAALDLEKCNIKAPVSGIINHTYIEEGSFMDIGVPVAEIIQIDKVKVIVGIPESDISQVRNLNKFEVKFDALKGQVFNAKKHYISKTTSSLARLYDLEITIPNGNHKILPGMFGRVEIVKQTIKGAVSVPLYSIIDSDKESYVYIVKKNIAYKQIIKTGIQEGWMIEVTEGLKINDELIIVGQRNVSDGQSVNIVQSVNDPEELSQ